MLFKHFMYTVYKTFHAECLKKNFHFFSYFINVLKTFPVKPSFLSYFINVFSKNICLENWNSKYVFGILNRVFGIPNMYLEYSKNIFGIPNNMFQILNLDGGSRLS